MYEMPIIAVVLSLLVGIGSGYLLFRGKQTDEGTALQAQPSNDATTNLIFRRGFTRAPIGMAYFATDGSWLQVNPKFLQILGYTRDELVDKSLRLLTHADDRRKESQIMNELRGGRGSSIAFTARLLRKNGDYGTYRIAISRCGDEEGGTWYQGVITDSAETADGETEFVTAFNDIGEVAVTRLDSLGNIVGWNRGAQQMFGFRATEVIGKSWGALHGEGGTATPAEILNAASDNGEYQVTGLRLRRDGTTLRVSATVMPQFRCKQLVGYVEIARDASLSRTAHEYREAYDRLRQVSEQRVTELTEEVDRLRRETASSDENGSRMRDVVTQLQASNKDLYNKAKLLGSALRKSMERRRELEDLLNIERGRHTEAAASAEESEQQGDVSIELQWTGVEGSAADVLTRCADEKATSDVVFRSGLRTKTFSFEDGRIIAAISNEPNLLLGHLLVRNEAISDSERHRVMEVQRETGIPFGRLLVLLDVLSEDEVGASLLGKIRSEVAELLTWSNVEFAMTPADTPSRRIVPLAVQVDGILSFVRTHVERRAGNGAELDDDAEIADAIERVMQRELDANLPTKTKEDEKELDDVVIGKSTGKSKKFHRPKCRFVATISARARVVFDSPAEAAEAGFTSCDRCFVSTKKPAGIHAITAVS